ncbi:MAG: hypothetical protein KGL11_07965 [Alphaproteobacteria bacterium]|nr:hypothetical protein [Alphaproteobacteria bacterium]
MPDVRIPHQVVYDVPEGSAISDVIESLRATEQLFFEVAPLLEQLVPGIQVGGVRVHIESLTQGSPLKEYFWVALFLTFQADLERDVPPLIGELTGIHVSPHYDSIVTVIFCLILFYGADFVYRQIVKTSAASRITAQLDGLIKDVSGHLGVDEIHIRGLLEKRYDKKRLPTLLRSAVQFFAPSKRQGNAPITIGRRRVDSDTVAEFPSDARIQDFDDQESTRIIEDVEIELHAQDLDRARQGWAGVIRQVSPNRLRMDVFAPIKTEEIFGQKRIRGDVVIVSRREPDGTMEPYMFHLIRVR